MHTTLPLITASLHSREPPLTRPLSLLGAPQLISPHFARSSVEEGAQEEGHGGGVKSVFIPLLAMQRLTW